MIEISVPLAIIVGLGVFALGLLVGYGVWLLVMRDRAGLHIQPLSPTELADATTGQAARDEAEIQRLRQELSVTRDQREGLRDEVGAMAAQLEAMSTALEGMSVDLDTAIAERDEAREEQRVVVSALATGGSAPPRPASPGVVDLRSEGDVADYPMELSIPDGADHEAWEMLDGLPEPIGADDLTRVEGIGPKMAAALQAASITTFTSLARSPQPVLRRAISDAGLRFAPSLPTWSRQAAYLALGDEDGLRAYTDYLIAGRDPVLRT